MAKTYRGRCRSCVASLKHVENDGTLAGVAVFSARNQQLPWYGFPADDRVTTLQITKLQLFQQATVLGSMLVALQHMQVSVCMFEGRNGAKSGISRFRKNNICFPQRVSELQQHAAFLSKLEIDDIVNVPRDAASEDHRTVDVVRARVQEITQRGIIVRVHGEPNTRTIHRAQIQAIVTLPWKPLYLSHALIVLRRRNRLSDEYI